MDILRGSSALSGYKVEKLTEALAKAGIEVASILFVPVLFTLLMLMLL